MATQTQTKAPPASRSRAGRTQRKASFRALQAGKDAAVYLLEYIHRDLLSRLDGVDRKIDGLESKVNKKIDGLESKVNEKIDGLDRKVDEKIEKQTRHFHWIMGIGFTVIGGGLLTVMLYLHSDTKQNIQRLDSRIDKIESRIDRIESRINKIESSIQEIRTLLIQSMQRQGLPLPAKQAGAQSGKR